MVNEDGAYWDFCWIENGFAHKLPVALDVERATFVCVQAEDVTPAGVRTWGEAHAWLWALRAAGRAVEVVVVGRDPERLAEAESVLGGWTKTAAPAGAADGGSEAGRAAKAEFAEIQAAVARGDLATGHPDRLNRPALVNHGG